jgi:hypothetical protein
VCQAETCIGIILTYIQFCIKIQMENYRRNSDHVYNRFQITGHTEISVFVYVIM